MSHMISAMGWGMDPDDGWTGGDSCRNSGLLVLEIAQCAAAGIRYVVADPLTWERHSACFEGLAKAFVEDPASVGERLSDVWRAVAGEIGGQAAEVLVPLMHAHGFDPVGDCDMHGMPEVSEGESS